MVRFLTLLKNSKLLIATIILVVLAACKAEKPQATPTGTVAATAVPPKVISTIKQVDQLPGIEELRIEGDGTIYLRSSGPLLELIDATGSLLLDRETYDPISRQFVDNQKARRPTEITLTIGSACSWEGISEGSQYKYLRVKDNRIEVHHTGTTRGGVPIDEILSSAPYRR